MFFLGLLVALWPMPALAEEVTVKATAAWQAQGHLFQVKEKQALFVGSFSGMLVVEPKQGALDIGKMLCPGLPSAPGTASSARMQERRMGMRRHLMWLSLVVTLVMPALAGAVTEADF